MGNGASQNNEKEGVEEVKYYSKRYHLKKSSLQVAQNIIKNDADFDQSPRNSDEDPKSNNRNNNDLHSHTMFLPSERIINIAEDIDRISEENSEKSSNNKLKISCSEDTKKNSINYESGLLESNTNTKKDIAKKKFDIAHKYSKTDLKMLDMEEEKSESESFISNEGEDPYTKFIGAFSYYVSFYQENLPIAREKSAKDLKHQLQDFKIKKEEQERENIIHNQKPTLIKLVKTGPKNSLKKNLDISDSKFSMKDSAKISMNDVLGKNDEKINQDTNTLQIQLHSEYEIMDFFNFLWQSRIDGELENVLSEAERREREIELDTIFESIEGNQEDGNEKLKFKTITDQYLLKEHICYNCQKGNINSKEPNSCNIHIFSEGDLKLFIMTEGFGPFSAEISNFACRVVGKTLLSDVNFFQNTEESMSDVFLKLEMVLSKAMQEESCPFDDVLSGASVAIAVKNKDTILLASTGAIKVCIVQLVDKDPNLWDQNEQHHTLDFSEVERIHRYGGEVRENNGKRCYVKGREYPGCINTRGIGCKIGKAIGILPKPIFRKYVLDKGKYDKMQLMTSRDLSLLFSEKDLAEICLSLSNDQFSIFNDFMIKKINSLQIQHQFQIEDFAYIAHILNK